MSAVGNSGRRPAAVSGQRGVLTTALLSRTGWAQVDRRKGKIVDELDSAEADDATRRKRSALDCHELGAEASVTKGSQALFDERAGKQRGAAEMGSMQAR
ncbi:hypothetical protein MBLNU13_g09315t1 [Cladosporium sp. NU13]